jgi:hypothetical protein
MVAEWIPLRAYATARGVTPDAISKAIRAGKLGLPHRKSNSDGRGTLEVLADLTELEPAPPPVADQSATVEALRAHLASVEAERDRALAAARAERDRLEQARKEHSATEAALRDRATAAEVEAATLRVERDRLRARGWWERLLDL